MALFQIEIKIQLLQQGMQIRMKRRYEISSIYVLYLFLQATEIFQQTIYMLPFPLDQYELLNKI